MDSYRIRPKGNYIQKANWQDLYALTQDWNEEIEFIKQDLEFLIRLIDNHFVKLLIVENLDEIRELQIELLSLLNQSDLLSIRIQINFKQLSKLIKQPLTYDAIFFRTEHEYLEDEVSEFIKWVRNIRKTVFKITKKALENNTSKAIWKYN
ncbi:hypothetical protein [Lacinutrix sp. Bg11-31]|uniref:hypothetical protein n=1 Tax=Lacinutrix sp. Bg11-31 TaxID=2057808 RepID=UPI000C313B7A|nr:hypothetical protein [Lacinutrix sp. Bg11-31]AUC81142.1 hypothetical protein CW733_02945 [Lacinutrix sp. Bg11-31]